ncbi:hypothetical protein [Campylobacter sp. US33a]|uniref:hypothetical protein n=1 Tax=Campylobacter sp. US33a TaxID=2498120 RepID=UPI001068C076|nr:hypothetical protein [Campylobacter sp. US33a]TEY04599.1 hypothetical protein ELQ16_00825 [Campylobacter sp. US33a]
MRYTNYEKDKICYFEIQDTDENFFDTFAMIMQKSTFSVEIEEREKYQSIPSRLEENAQAMQIIQNSDMMLFIRLQGELCIWCYKEGVTTIVFDYINALSEFILKDFFNLYEKFQNGELNLEEDEDDEEYDDSDEEDEENSDANKLEAFRGINHFQGIDEKLMLEFARQMDAMQNYYKDEFEQSGAMKPKDKALKIFKERARQNALMKVLNLSFEEFNALSPSDLEKCQEIIDEKMKDFIAYVKSRLYYKDVDLILFMPLQSTETKQSVGFIKNEEKINNNHEYFYNLLIAGAKVEHKYIETIREMKNFYYFLLHSLCESYEKLHNIKIDHQALIVSFPRYKILTKIGLALYTCLVTNGLDRLNALENMEDLDLNEKWQDDEMVDFFQISSDSKPKLLNYQRVNYTQNGRIETPLMGDEVSGKIECFDYKLLEKLLKNNHLNNKNKPEQIKTPSSFENDDEEFISDTAKENLNEFLNEKLNEKLSINALNILFEEILEQVSGENSSLYDILDEYQSYDLIYSEEFANLLQKSVSKKSLEKINIFAIYPVFGTNVHYALNLKNKRILFELNQQSFLCLLKSGVKITEEQIVRLEKSKELYEKMQILNLEHFNENLEFYKNNILGLFESEKEALQKLEKIVPKEFLVKNKTFTMLEQILELLKSCINLDKEKRVNFIQEFELKDWQVTKGEVFVYDEFSIQNRFMGFLGKESKDISKTRLLSCLETDEFTEIHKFGKTIYENFVKGEKIFCVELILNILGIIKESEEKTQNFVSKEKMSFKEKILSFLPFYKKNQTDEKNDLTFNTPEFGLIDKLSLTEEDNYHLVYFLDSHRVNNIIFAQNGGDVFNIIEQALELIDCNFSINNIDKNASVQCFIFRDKNIKDYTLAFIILEDARICNDFLDEDYFDRAFFDGRRKENLAFLKNLAPKEGYMMLHSCFYRGLMELENLNIHHFIGHSQGFYQIHFKTLLKQKNYIKIFITCIDRSKKVECENLKTTFDEEFIDYICECYEDKEDDSIFLYEKDEKLYILLCEDTYYTKEDQDLLVNCIRNDYECGVTQHVSDNFYELLFGKKLETKTANDLLFKAITTSDFELFKKALNQGANINGRVSDQQEVSKYTDIDCTEGTSYYVVAIYKILENIDLEDFREEALKEECKEAFKILYFMRDSVKIDEEMLEEAKEMLEDTHGDWWYDTYKEADLCGYEGNLDDEEALIAWLSQNKGLRYFETLGKDLGLDLKLSWR